MLHVLKKKTLEKVKKTKHTTQTTTGQQQRLAYSAGLLAKAGIVGVAIFNKTRCKVFNNHRRVEF